LLLGRDAANLAGGERRPSEASEGTPDAAAKAAEAEAAVAAVAAVAAKAAEAAEAAEAAAAKVAEAAAAGWLDLGGASTQAAGVKRPARTVDTGVSSHPAAVLGRWRTSCPRASAPER